MTVTLSASLARRLSLLLPAALLIGAAPPGGTLRIEVDNVRAATGRVHGDLCTRDQFLKDCPISAAVPARVGKVTLVFSNLPAGSYGAQLYYDQNGNDRVDRGLFGIPKEGVGFSNDAPIRLSPPRWEDAAFTFDGGDRTIRVRLRYFIGPDAPRS